MKDGRFLRLDAETRMRVKLWREMKLAQERKQKAEQRLNALALAVFLVALGLVFVLLRLP